jgi:uncharacterized protein (TIGR02466 family)
MNPKHTDYEHPDAFTAIGVPFLHTTVEDSSSVLSDQRERSLEIVKEHPGEYGAAFTNSCGSWNSSEVYNNIIQEEDVFEPLSEYVSQLLPSYLSALRLDWNNSDPVITDSWLNASPKGNVQECHIHPHCYIAGVYYIHIPEGEGSEFVLDNPIDYQHTVGLGSRSLLQDATLDVQSGDMILFPSHLEHHTRVNYSDEMRFSLAFNISTTQLLPEYMDDEGGAPWESEDGES